MFKIGNKALKLINILWQRPKGWHDFLLSLLSYSLRSTQVWGKPVHITIEPANICNLQCPICETGSGLMKRTKGQMTLEQFKKIIDQTYSHTNTILLYFMGEPFIHKDAYEMIRYARMKKIFVTTCTNGEFVNAREMVDTGLTEISFQIGGLTQETHEVYRVGSNLEKIKANIRALANEKKKRNLTIPKIALGFIIMKHNEKELPALDAFAKEMGVDEAQVISPCVRNIDQAHQFLPEDRRYWIYDETKLKQGTLAPGITDKKCPWIYFSTLILWNGDVVPCCRDAHGEMVMGNIFNRKLKDIWNDRKYRQFRKTVFMDPEQDLCRLCSGYGLPDLKKRESADEE